MCAARALGAGRRNLFVAFCSWFARIWTNAIPWATMQQDGASSMVRLRRLAGDAAVSPFRRFLLPVGSVPLFGFSFSACIRAVP